MCPYARIAGVGSPGRSRGRPSATGCISAQLPDSVHGDNQDAVTLHETVTIDLVDCDVSDCQLQQRYFINSAGSIHRDQQKTVWKLGHAIRTVMAAVPTELPLLMGVVELDEKYLGGRPRFQRSLKHKGGHGTAKQCVAVALEREGSVKAALVRHNGESAHAPFVKAVFANKVVFLIFA